MALILMLDASPLGRLVHLRHNINIGRWVDEALGMGATIYLPEISDFELRRSLLSMNAARQLRALDEFCEQLSYPSAQHRDHAPSRRAVGAGQASWAAQR